MSFLYEHEQQRREVEELHRLAMDALREAQYATMERLLERAAATAERLDDLPLLIEERSWLAEARRMQGKDAQALSTYTWLIGLATGPTQSQQLRDKDTLQYLAQAFMNFTLCGYFLTLPLEQLLRVVSDGLDWLERVGQPNWAAGLRLRRGLFFKAQQRWQEARQEMEVALALKRRHPEAPGYNLSGHLLQLADLLCQEQVRAYAETISLAEEALVTANSNTYDYQWAYKVLAYAHLGLHEYKAALQAAQQSFALSHSIQVSVSITNAYQVLGKIYRAAGRLSDAASAAAHQWRWALQVGRVDGINEMLIDCIRLRLLQTREACGLSLENEELPAVLLAMSNWKLAQRRLASARRLIQRARPFASQFDQASGNHSAQDELAALDIQIDQLIALLVKNETH